MYYALAGAVTVLLSKSIFIHQGSLGWCKFSNCLFLGLDFLPSGHFKSFFFVFESLAQVPCYKLLTILACLSWSWDYYIGTGHACASLPLVHTASNMGQHTCISQYNPHARLVRCYCKIFKMLIDVVTLSLYFYCFFRALQHVKLLQKIFIFQMKVIPLNNMKKRRVVRTNLNLKCLIPLVSIRHQVMGNIIERGKIGDWWAIIVLIMFIIFYVNITFKLK